MGRRDIRAVSTIPDILEKTGLQTPEHEEVLARTHNTTAEQLRKSYIKDTIPIGRSGRLSEVADFVCYLLSEYASYITGVTTNITGGKTRGQGGLVVSAIFCAHGKLARAMLESVQMVCGDASVEVVAFVPGGNVSDIVEKLKKLVSTYIDDEWLVAVDSQCGSPRSATATLATYNPAIRVISGLSLLLALELVDNQGNMDVDELCEHLTTTVQRTCVVWKHLETAEEDL